MAQITEPPLWVVSGFVLAITATAAWGQPPSSIVERGIAFGEQHRLSGVYFSNFENSKFIGCDRSRAECDRWTEREQEVVYCAPMACDDLESRIKKLVGSHDKWALYKIDFIGRRSMSRTQKQSIHDTESKVYLEKIEAFDLIKTE